MSSEQKPNIDHDPPQKVGGVRVEQNKGASPRIQPVNHAAHDAGQRIQANSNDGSEQLTESQRAVAEAAGHTRNDVHSGSKPYNPILNHVQDNQASQGSGAHVRKGGQATEKQIQQPGRG